MSFARRFTKPGSSMSNYNMPRPAGSVIGPPRKQGESGANAAGKGDQTEMKSIFNDPALKLQAKTKSKFGFDTIGKRSK